MQREVYLICNAHIDPMWLWEWEEGAAATLSTFRSAARLCEKYGAFVFNHNEALLYQWIEEYEPSLFEKIQKLVKEGKWNIMGGWFDQPDCNLPSGEGFVRQITAGNAYFEEKFQKKSFDTAVNFDSFGHSRGLVQILAQSGYRNYLVCRPIQSQLDIPDEFIWVGYDRSEIYVRRHYELYNSPLGKAAQKIEGLIREKNENPLMILWGVGNHGGGPSDQDLSDIESLAEALKKEGIVIKHATPEEYFSAAKARNRSVAKIEKSLRPAQVGCYTSQAKIKKGYRRLENELLLTEKMCSVAAEKGLMQYPSALLKEAERDMLFVQFHDILPGSGIKEVEEKGLHLISHGIKILAELKAKAYFALSNLISYQANGNYPVLVYNPHPYEREVVVDCQFQLADQNWTDTFTVMDVYSGEEKLPSQIEKESCNLNLDWRKRVVFKAKLKPMSMNLFECRPRLVPSRGNFALENGVYRMQGLYMAEVEAKNGSVVCLKNDGVDLFGKCPFGLSVFSDTEDAWAMRDFQAKRIGEEIGNFTLVSEEESTRYSGVKHALPALRMVESGQVRDVLEGVYGFHSSRAVIQYAFYKQIKRVDIKIRVMFDEKDKCLKLKIPFAFRGELIGEQAFGAEALRVDSGEDAFHKWCLYRGEKQCVGIVNKGTYAASFENNTLYLNLLRTPAYTGHPIDEREILQQDRFTERMDAGESEFDFSVFFGETAQDIAVQAELLNQPPMALSFFPNGQGGDAPFMNLGGGVLLSALYREGENSYMRLFNPSAQAAECKIEIASRRIAETVPFGAYQVKTFLIGNGTLHPVNFKGEKI